MLLSRCYYMHASSPLFPHAPSPSSIALVAALALASTLALPLPQLPTVQDVVFDIKVRRKKLRTASASDEPLPSNRVVQAEWLVLQVKQHASKAQPHVKQAKILRDPEKVGGPDGLPRSRGLGFVEFLDHEHSICALRQLNNNPAPFGRRPPT